MNQTNELTTCSLQELLKAFGEYQAVTVNGEKFAVLLIERLRPLERFEYRVEGRFYLSETASVQRAFRVQFFPDLNNVAQIASLNS